jgi:two-component system, LytTR family, sensor kinase
MILRLSDLLTYPRYETNEKQVPLVKEINRLHNYTRLKELIFGEQLKTEIPITGEVNMKIWKTVKLKIKFHASLNSLLL